MTDVTTTIAQPERRQIHIRKGRLTCVAGANTGTAWMVEGDITRIGSIKDGQNVIGNRVKVRIVKNKMAAPFREAEFDLMFGEGISREGSLLDMAELHGLVQKSGTWFSYEGERLGQGRENVKRYLKENPEVAEKVEHQVRQAVGLAEPDAAADENAAEEAEVEEKQEA